MSIAATVGPKLPGTFSADNGTTRIGWPEALKLGRHNQACGEIRDDADVHLAPKNVPLRAVFLPGVPSIRWANSRVKGPLSGEYHDHLRCMGDKESPTRQGYIVISSEGNVTVADASFALGRRTQGLDQSVVFNARYYLARYPDLAAAFGLTSDKAAVRHWLQHGIDEGRSGSLLFDAGYYLETHADLAQALGRDSYLDGARHWLTHGISEGRRATPAFDPQYYLARYPDLTAAFGADFRRAAQHWLGRGIREGRSGSADFDPVYYLASHADVAQAFGAQNYYRALMHWLVHGRAEGRKAAP